jgi:TolB protein
MRSLTTGRPDTDPDWSPDGRAIAFVRGVSLSSFTDANDDLYVLDLDTGQERQLTRTPAGTFEAAPAWSPDGARIAFVRTTRRSEFDGTASLHVIDRDGAAERRLHAYELFANSPFSLAWSPDGRSIAFETSSKIGCTSISVVDVSTGSLRPATSCARPREATVAPSWQPAPERAD